MQFLFEFDVNAGGFVVFERAFVGLVKIGGDTLGSAGRSQIGFAAVELIQFGTHLFAFQMPMLAHQIA